MEERLTAYAPFVPHRLVLRHAREPDAPAHPHAEAFEAVVLFADVTGYTALTETYSERGRDGIEQLESLFKSFFGRIEELITAHGGDIIGFAGDSVVALWVPPDGCTLAAAVEDAGRCALQAQSSLQSAGEGKPSPLRMCIGIGCGEVLFATVGGCAGEWRYVAGGAAVSGAAEAQMRAAGGCVLLSPSAAALVHASCVGRPLAEHYLELVEVRGNREPRPRGTLAVHSTATALRRYIPSTVLEHLDAGQSAWLAEFRRATTVFLGVRGLDYAAPDVLARLQDITSAVQEEIAALEGTFTRFGYDDKGTNLLCVWGLPGRAHEDDAARAVFAALRARERLRALGFALDVGIATGRVLCGLCGGGSRYEYSVTGATVNLAARLMSAARGAVLCDSPTANEARSRIAFDPHAPVEVKGTRGAVAVEQARSILERTFAPEDLAAEHTPIGRECERRQLAQAMDALSGGASSLVVIEGDAGAGKSRLVDDLRMRARTQGVRCIVGKAEEIEENTAYFPWAGVLEQIFRAEGALRQDERRACVKALFETQPELAARAPLLNAILPLGLPDEKEIAARMSEQARAESTYELVAHIVGAAARRAPTVLVLEDAHWMDSLSWELAARVQRRVQPLMLVIVQRALPVAATRHELLLLPEVLHVRLEPLGREHTEALLREKLHAEHIGPGLLDFVYGKANGHPLFTEELANVLGERGWLHFEAGHCDLDSEAADAQSLELDTVERVIASRLDGLSPDERFTLGLASVVGPSFPLSIVRAIHPEGSFEAEIARQFAAFVDLDFLRAESDTIEPRYLFKHALTQETTYNLLHPARLRELHSKIAAWYEEAHRENLHPLYPLLAHHWTRAQHAPKAADFLHKAGEQALATYANREAERFLAQALEQLARLEHGPQPGERASVQRLLGHARLWLGKLDESRRVFEQSFADERPIPATRAALAVGAVRELFEGLGVRLAPRRRRRAANKCETEAVVALLRLGHIGYFEDDIALSAYTSLRCLNFAAMRAPSREIALIYAAMASGAGMVPLRRLAHRYIDLALKVNEGVEDDSTSAQVLLFVAMYSVGAGEWDLAAERIERADALGRSIGDPRRRADCGVVAGYLHYYQGDFAQAYRRYEEVAAGGRARSERQTRGWGLLGMSRVRLAQGCADEALPLLEQAQPLVGDRLSRIELYGQLALVRLRLMDLGEAHASAQTALSLVTQARPTSFSTLTGTAAAAETLLALHGYAREGRFVDETGRLERQARAALRALRLFARIFPIGEPACLLQRGAYALLAGRQRRAVLLWQESVTSARKLGMHHEEHRAALALAEHTSKSHTAFG